MFEMIDLEDNSSNNTLLNSSNGDFVPIDIIIECQNDEISKSKLSILKLEQCLAKQNEALSKFIGEKQKLEIERDKRRKLCNSSYEECQKFPYKAQEYQKQNMPDVSSSYKNVTSVYLDKNVDSSEGNLLDMNKHGLKILDLGEEKCNDAPRTEIESPSKFSLDEKNIQNKPRRKINRAAFKPLTVSTKLEENKLNVKRPISISPINLNGTPTRSKHTTTDTVLSRCANSIISSAANDKIMKDNVAKNVIDTPNESVSVIIRIPVSVSTSSPKNTPDKERNFENLRIICDNPTTDLNIDANDSSHSQSLPDNSPIPMAIVQKLKSGLCKYFKRNGSCRNGDKCSFIHVVPTNSHMYDSLNVFPLMSLSPDSQNSARSKHEKVFKTINSDGPDEYEKPPCQYLSRQGHMRLLNNPKVPNPHYETDQKRKLNYDSSTTSVTERYDDDPRRLLIHDDERIVVEKTIERRVLEKNEERLVLKRKAPVTIFNMDNTPMRILNQDSSEAYNCVRNEEPKRPLLANPGLRPLKVALLRNKVINQILLISGCIVCGSHGLLVRLTEKTETIVYNTNTTIDVVRIEFVNSCNVPCIVAFTSESVLVFDINQIIALKAIDLFGYFLAGIEDITYDQCDFYVSHRDGGIAIIDKESWRVTNCRWRNNMNNGRHLFPATFRNRWRLLSRTDGMLYKTENEDMMDLVPVPGLRNVKVVMNFQRTKYLCYSEDHVWFLDEGYETMAMLSFKFGIKILERDSFSLVVLDWNGTVHVHSIMTGDSKFGKKIYEKDIDGEISAVAISVNNIYLAMDGGLFTVSYVT